MGDNGANEALVALAGRCPPRLTPLRELGRALEEADADVDALVDMAMARGDDAPGSLIYAGSLVGRRVSADRVPVGAEAFANAEMLADLMGRLGGDRVGRLLDFVEQTPAQPTHFAALFLAVELLDGEPPPERLTRLLKHYLRGELNDELGGLLARAAERLGDESVRTVGRRWWKSRNHPRARGVAKILLDALRAPPEKHLRDDRNEVTTASGSFTARRAEAKRGRNDPCPCGSGKKLKKCCGRAGATAAPRPSPVAGVSMEEFARQAHLHLRDPAQLAYLAPEAMAELPPSELDDGQLVVVLRTLGRARIFEAAERALEELDRREGVSDAPALRLELVILATRADQIDLARRVAGERGGGWLLALRRALLEAGGAIERVEARCRELAQAPDADASRELVVALLDHTPALGLLVGRGTLDASDPARSVSLLQQLDSTRDRLGLAPDEPGWELLDALLDARARVELERHTAAETARERDALLDELATLRARVLDERDRATEKARELADARRALSRLEARAAPEGAEALKRAQAERVRLRGKVDELVTLIEEGKRERAALRRELGEATGRLARQADEPPGRLDEAGGSPAEEVDGGPAEPPRALLVPVFSPRGRDAVVALPSRVGRSAVALAGALAAGEPSAWRRVKRMQVVDRVLTVRIGRDHRLLFRPGDAELEVLDVVDRRDLSGALAVYR